MSLDLWFRTEGEKGKGSYANLAGFSVKDEAMQLTSQEACLLGLNTAEFGNVDLDLVINISFMQSMSSRKWTLCIQVIYHCNLSFNFQSHS